MKSIIELSDVYKVYGIGTGRVVALNGVSLTIKRGEFVSIMGPSGSGKSTLMHIIGCLDIPTRGKVRINGKAVEKMNEDQLSHLRAYEIGFVFQSFNLFPRLTALENVMMPMNFTNIKNKEKRARDLLSDVGLHGRESHRPNQLSGGQRQKIAIARALANDPDIILADEPTGNLDSKSGNEIMRIFTKLNDEGKTIVLVTHDKSISKYSHRVIRIKDGKIVGG